MIQHHNISDAIVLQIADTKVLVSVYSIMSYPSVKQTIDV